MTRAGVEVAVDIGGTFTDVVLLADGEAMHEVKVPTSPDRVDGVLEGVHKVLDAAGLSPDTVTRFVHGSTVATNAVLEERGAIVGMLVTDGFEDVLEIGRQKRSRMYELMLEPETPGFLAPRRRRLGIAGRIGPDGEELVPLDEEAVRAAVRRLVEREGAEAIAVSYLFSYFNPAHEHRTRDIIASIAPDVHVSLSSDVDPRSGEYERLVVTGFDAYLRGVIRTYIDELEEGLDRAGIAARLRILQSRGGITGTAAVARRPVTMLLSGLAGGVIGAVYAAERAGFKDVITVDMGGTSCDVALVHGRKPLIATESKIGRWPLRLPMIDVNTIGAGGGSIAWVDEGGSLRVGPRSAGSDPGPACYGRGGEEATVTDASVVLGYLNPSFFAGGELLLEPELAERAVGRLAERLGLSVVQTAHGIHRIVNARMADEIRIVSVRRGYDHRRFAVVALGGAGPTHGGALLRELGVPRMVVPSVPGVLSAFGLLLAPVEHDQIASLGRRVQDVTSGEVTAVLDDLRREGITKMQRDDVDPGDVEVSEFADFRHVGQSQQITVPIERAAAGEMVEDAAARFHEQYHRLFGHSDPEALVELSALRSVLTHSLPSPDPRLSPDHESDASADMRQVYFPEAGGYVDTPVYVRWNLAPGRTLEGPVVVEQPDTTTVVHPGQSIRVEAGGSMILEEGT